MADSAFHAIRRGGYTNIDNDIFKHGLSARAIGLLVLMLSKPPDWKFSSERLANQVSEGRDAIRSALTELSAAGFVVRRKIGGTEPRTEVYVRDSCYVDWPWEKQQVGSTAWESGVGESGVGKPGPLVTTEEVTTEIHPQPSADGRYLDIWFDAFWGLYPRRVGKKDAYKAFVKMWDGNHYNAMWAGLEARVAWWKASGTPTDKIPYPASWLNGERWNDEIEPVVRQTAPRATTQERFAQAAEMVENMNGESIFDRMRRAGAPEQKAIGQ